MADSLGNARRANGARIEKQRRGADNATARRANGDRIESARKGAAVQDDINALVRPVVARKQLKTVPPLGPLAARRGQADYKAPPAATTGGGIASPLTESGIIAREWHATGWPSSDGIWEYPASKKISLVDADGVPLVVILAAP